MRTWIVLGNPSSQGVLHLTPCHAQKVLPHLSTDSVPFAELIINSSLTTGFFLPTSWMAFPIFFLPDLTLANLYSQVWGFPGVSVVKSPPTNAGDPRDSGSIPGSGRSLGGGNGNPLQYSCLEQSMDKGAWWATVHGVMKSQTHLSDWAWTHSQDYPQIPAAPRRVLCFVLFCFVLFCFVLF